MQCEHVLLRLLLTATKPSDGRATAPQPASASLASFLFDLT
jgi:hypothetical protein